MTTEREIRQIILDGLQAGSVFRVKDMGLTDAFLAGTADATFEELEVDSLAAMELCIAVELGTGVSLAPDDLEKIGSLQKLVARVQGG